MTPPDACRSYKYLFAKMKGFERDLMLQIQLENDILFPMAIQMDEKFPEKEIKIEIR
jgi:regulator of cell morphogenesis and NO signaling